MLFQNRAERADPRKFTTRPPRASTQQGKIPTAAQLDGFIKNITTNMFRPAGPDASALLKKACVAGAPPNIKQELSAQFAPVWTVSSSANHVAEGVTLSLEILGPWLTKVVAYYGSRMGAARAEAKTNLDPTPEELDLSDLSAAITKLWYLDDNRLEPNVDYELNLQHDTQHGLAQTQSARPCRFSKVRDGSQLGLLACVQPPSGLCLGAAVLVRQAGGLQEDDLQGLRRAA